MVFLTFDGFSSSDAAEFKLTELKSKIQSPHITEASGLAVSSRDAHFLWAINDSGGSPEIHLVGADGADGGKVKISNAKNMDWEDIASFTWEGKPWLLVADTGDNAAKRDSCSLHFLPEPKLPAAGQKLAGEVVAAWRIEFTYEGGARDCEAVAVDVTQRKIILISKRTTPPEVYELRLEKPQKKGVLIAKKIGETAVDGPVVIPFSSQPVGMDISAGDSLAAVVSYARVFLFPRKPEENWAEAFARKPVGLEAHGLGQVESVAFSKDGKSIFVVAEGKNPWLRVYQR